MIDGSGMVLAAGAVVAFGIGLYALMSWLDRRPIDRYYPPERPVRYRQREPWRGQLPARDNVTPLRGTIIRGGHPAGTALAPRRGGLDMPPKPHLSPSYRAYLASPEWAAKSRAFLFEHQRCELRLPGCTGRATQCHHRTYAELFHETARTLQAVCASCHTQEEWRKVQARGW